MFRVSGLGESKKNDVEWFVLRFLFANGNFLRAIRNSRRWVGILSISLLAMFFLFPVSSVRWHCVRRNYWSMVSLGCLPVPKTFGLICRRHGWWVRVEIHWSIWKDRGRMHEGGLIASIGTVDNWWFIMIRSWRPCECPPWGKNTSHKVSTGMTTWFRLVQWIGRFKDHGLWVQKWTTVPLWFGP